MAQVNKNNMILVVLILHGGRKPTVRQTNHTRYKYDMIDDVVPMMELKMVNG